MSGPPPSSPVTPVTPSAPDAGTAPPPRRPPPASLPPPSNVPGSSPPPPDVNTSPPPPSLLSPYPPPPPPQSLDWPSTSAISKSGSSGTAVGIGVAVGAVVLLGLAAVLIFCLVSKQRRHRRKLLPATAADFYDPRQTSLQALSTTPSSPPPAALMHQVNEYVPENDPYGMPNCIRKLKTLGLTPSEQYKVINHLKEDLLNRQTFMEVEADVLEEIIKVVVQA